jgi:hypothetical protein
MSEPRPAAPMSHEAAAGELAAAALSALAPADHDAVMAHAAVCPQCARELAALRAVAASMAGVPAGPVSGANVVSERRRRLVDRARADQRAGRTAGSVDSPDPRSIDRGATGDAAGRPHAHEPLALTEHLIVPTAAGPRRRAAPRWLSPLGALAATVGFAVAGIGYLGAREELRQLRSQVGLVDQRHAAELAVLRTALRERDEQMALLTGPSVQVVELASSRAASPKMRVFWDRASDTWTLVGHGMPALPDGKAYQVWLVSGERRLSAGTFVPTSRGDALYRTTHRLEGAPLTAVAITVEPEGGVPVATGPVVMLGAVARGS